MKPGGTDQPWTPAEDKEFLALLELKIDRATIARILNRTVSALDIA